MRLFMLIIHFLGLAMGMGTGFGYMFLGMAGARMEQNEARKFALNSFALSRMGTIGIILLILSGIYLVIPFWPTLLHFPYLVTKLALVLLLVILLVINGNLVRKAQNGNPDPNMKKLRKLGPVSLLTSILIVIMAVLSFR